MAETNLFEQLVEAVQDVDWSQLFNRTIGTGLQVVIIVVLAFALRWVTHRALDRFVGSANRRHLARLAKLPGVAGEVFEDAGLGSSRQKQRMETTGSILKSIATVVIMGTALLMVLDLLGIPLGPLIASAGVGGIAIAFGAQSLVKDFLSGVFMVAEDQYGVGDTVDVGTVTGTVEEVGLRITRLRDVNGIVWYVRNGEILRVGNVSQGWSMANVDVQVGYREDIAAVVGYLKEALAPLVDSEQWKGQLLEAPTVTGYETMAGGIVTLRVSAKCPAGKQFGVQREIRELAKAALDAHGVALAVPPAPAAAGSA